MNEWQTGKEYRRWFFWRILSRLGWGLKRGTVMRTDSDSLRSHGGEPPMVELERLAEDGLPDESVRNRETVKQLSMGMSLFAAVTRDGSDNIVKGEKLVREFLMELLPDDMDESEIEPMLASYRDDPGKFQQVRGDIFLLKKQVDHQSLKKLVEYLYKLIYPYENNLKESRDIGDFAERLGLSSAEVRMVVADVRRKLEN